MVPNPGSEIRVERAIAPSDIDEVAPERESEADSRFSELLQHPDPLFPAAQKLTVGLASCPVPLELELDQGQLTDASARTLARYLWDAIRRGHRGIELRLKPTELGGLTVRVDVQGREVHVEARAQDPRVAELLLASRSELAQALARWGLVLGRLSVFTDEDQGSAQLPVEILGNSLPATAPRRSFIEVVA
jgi:flagellar hook-length control protein FliK